MVTLVKFQLPNHPLRSLLLVAFLGLVKCFNFTVRQNDDRDSFYDLHSYRCHGGLVHHRPYHDTNLWVHLFGVSDCS